MLGLIAFTALPNPAVCSDLESKMNFTLPVPENQTYRSYLGLTGQGSFYPWQIEADVVIIEIFSMYCPICQREAANVNTLFDLIRNRPEMRKRIKLIGIGAGNTAFEVNFFKENYSIEFPLFSDGDFTIHKQIGEVRTPHFFGFTISKNKKIKVLFVNNQWLL